MILARVPGSMRSGKSIVITRGTQTMEAGSEPLYIVDGFEIRSISHITPMEVESLTAIKGTETTAYGVKGANGANGVIEIKLKK